MRTFTLIGLENIRTRFSLSLYLFPKAAKVCAIDTREIRDDLIRIERFVRDRNNYVNDEIDYAVNRIQNRLEYGWVTVRSLRLILSAIELMKQVIDAPNISTGDHCAKQLRAQAKRLRLWPHLLLRSLFVRLSHIDTIEQPEH